MLRRIEKTDAESVEDIVEASSSASTNGISIPSHGATSHTNEASMNSVMTTPAVASTTPGPMMGFISENFVSIPPVKRMMHKAIIPTNWVISTERNEMKFKPNSMPTPRNSNNAGAPKRYATLPAITATKSSNAPTNTTFSPLMSIITYLFLYACTLSATFSSVLSAIFSSVSGLYSRSAYSKACMAAKRLPGVR